MDFRKEMIIIDNIIVTNNVLTCVYNPDRQVYYIIYRQNEKKYIYSKGRVKVLTKCYSVDMSKYDIFLNNKKIKNVKEVIVFTDNNNLYYHILFTNNTFEGYDSKEIKKIRKNPYSVLSYMKEISDIVSLDTDDGKKILSEQMKKIDIDEQNSILSTYFKFNNDIELKTNSDDLIFPFGCNTSQYNAVRNAIYNKISVIEGPPGTGKTQTILNIIANLLIRNMNCQVVSNNNAAIENIEEKLKKYNLDFFVALLGKRDNKNSFIENQKDLEFKFKCDDNLNLLDISKELKNLSNIVKEVYASKREIAFLTQKENDLLLEYKYFKLRIENQGIRILPLKRYSKKNLKKIWISISSLDRLSLLNKLIYIFIYRVGNFKFYRNDIINIFYSIQDIIYQFQLNELRETISLKEKFVGNNKEKEDEYVKLSMKYFQKYLFTKYINGQKKYSIDDISKNYSDFINDYPVILSTTHSSRNTFNNEFKFDYIIMDESSQIDVVTGSLALSSAKYAVIIGDEKQLPNVVSESVKRKTDKIFYEYSIDIGYSYSINSLLSSIKKIINNIPIVLLQEHYRCHPKIINFCNKKFYNNQLIIMTHDNNEKNVIRVIRTNKGNHSRDKANQRQLDVLKELVSEYTDIGIIAPYNNQVNLISSELSNIEVSTVHKFQGREKDTIIISTVDDEISDFVANSNILNVAISRAKKNLIFIVTGNEIKNRNINDFINYVEYNNMEVSTSKIYSVFDFIYKQYELERIDFYKKHNKVSKFDTENLVYYLINDIIKSYDNLSFVFLQRLSSLIQDKNLLTLEEKRYVNHHSTHVDFLIYNKFGKKPILAIEVDGYKYHKKGTRQYDRDLLKNQILEKYGIPILRLKTNGSGEEKIIRNMLDKICM